MNGSEVSQAEERGSFLTGVVKNTMTNLLLLRCVPIDGDRLISRGATPRLAIRMQGKAHSLDNFVKGKHLSLKNTTHM